VADYAPNFTARHKLTYSFEGDQHECTTRWPSANTQLANESLALDFWTSFFSATAALRHTTFAIVAAEYAVADSNVFLPSAAMGELAAGTRAANSGASGRIMHSIWPMRSSLGHGARFMMFGLHWGTAEDDLTLNFYVTPAENTLVQTIATLLVVSEMVGPDDEDIVLARARVAYKQNDAWVNKRRAGT
jgi:hypothetical protein